MPFYLIEIKEQKTEERISLAFPSSMVEKSFPKGKIFLGESLKKTIKEEKEKSINTAHERLSGIKLKIALKQTVSTIDQALKTIRDESQYLITNTDKI